MPDLVGNTFSNDIVPLQETVAGIDPDANLADFSYYRRLGGGSRIDLPPYTQELMQKVSLDLFRRNPYAHRIVKLIASFAAGPGLKFKADHPKVQQVLFEHWHHPINNWDRLFYQCIFELGLYGEVFLSAHVMDDGSVTWGTIDPLRVHRILPDEVDLARPAKIEIRRVDLASQVGSTGLIPMEIIQYDGKAESPTKGFRTGEVLFYSTNIIRGGLRGMSDIFPLADYLDGIDQFMFSLQQRIGLQNNFIWDVTLEGMSEEQIRTWLSSIYASSPRPGSVRAHNERVKWSAVSPNFSAGDSSDHVRLFLNYILGGAGLASWMLGDMGSANRAATESSAAVVMRTMEQRQLEAKCFLQDVFNFVIDQKIKAGRLPDKRKFNREFYISMPKIGLRDFQRMANSLRQGAEGIKTLYENNLVDEDRARSLASELLNQLGLEGADKRIGSISESINDDNNGDSITD